MPFGNQCRPAKESAVVRWTSDAPTPEFHAGPKCDSWEVLVPELMFEQQDNSIERSLRRQLRFDVRLGAIALVGIPAPKPPATA